MIVWFWRTWLSSIGLNYNDSTILLFTLDFVAMAIVLSFLLSYRITNTNTDSTLCNNTPKKNLSFHLFYALHSMSHNFFGCLSHSVSVSDYTECEIDFVSIDDEKKKIKQRSPIIWPFFFSFLLFCCVISVEFSCLSKFNVKINRNGSILEIVAQFLRYLPKHT